MAIDSRITKMLDSPDAEKRKKAVMALAKTRDMDALPYLAKVYRSDQNDEIRELARKAGVYIKKNAVEPEPDPEPEYDYGHDAHGGYDDDNEDDYDYLESRLDRSTGSSSSSSSGYDDYDSYQEPLYYDDEVDDDDPTADEPEEDAAPLPSEIVVSKAAEERARGIRDQAMDMSVRGDNNKAAEYMRRALRTDPRLMHDRYTITLASTITGLDGEEAIQRLAPSASELDKKRKKQRTRSAAPASGGSIQRVLAAVMVFSAIVVLVGYIVMPWLDMGQVETLDEFSGEVITLDQSFDQAREQINALFTLAGSQSEGEVDEAFQQIIDAIDSINLALNGIDVTLVSIGQQNVLEAMGFVDFLETFMIGPLGEFTQESDTAEVDTIMAEFEATVPEPALLDYTLPLVPVTAVLALVLGVILLRGGSISTWLISVVVGLLGIAPMIYFYLSGVNTTLPESDTVALDTFGTLDLPTATDLLGLGFWVSLAAMMAIVIIPFVALLLMPSAEREPASA